MPANERKSLALLSLAKTQPLTELAAQQGISRKFIYQQQRQATFPLDQAFAAKNTNTDVLFHLPVTPQHTIADASQELRAGQTVALGGTPCHGDVFHILKQCESLANVLARIAKDVRTLVDWLSNDILALAGPDLTWRQQRKSPMSSVDCLLETLESAARTS